MSYWQIPAPFVISSLIFSAFGLHRLDPSHAVEETRLESQLNVAPSARSVRCSAVKVFHRPATMAERRRCRCGSVPLAAALANDSRYTFNNAALTGHTHPFV